MTVSLVMAVTMPRIRLRADAPPMAPTAAGCASSWATAASWAPSTVRRPASSVAAVEAAGVDHAPDGVVGDAEQGGSLGDTQMRHE